jgi:hypothetical protein
MNIVRIGDDRHNFAEKKMFVSYCTSFYFNYSQNFSEKGKSAVISRQLTMHNDTVALLKA